MSWNVNAAIEYLDSHGGRATQSTGYCATATVAAIQAGGVHMGTTMYAKDFGPCLLAAGFTEVETTDFKRGDIAVIQAVPKHPAGHMCMFDGEQWISDFAQGHGSGVDGMYPGSAYRIAKPSYKIYRM